MEEVKDLDGMDDNIATITNKIRENYFTKIQKMRDEGMNLD
jgi:hypothetical protein